MANKTLSELAKPVKARSNAEYWIKYAVMAFCSGATILFFWGLFDDFAWKIIFTVTALLIFEGAAIGWGMLYLNDAQDEQLDISRKAENIMLFVSVFSTLAELATLTPLGKDFIGAIHIDLVALAVIGAAIVTNVFYITKYFRADPDNLNRVIERQQLSLEHAAEHERKEAKFKLEQAAKKDVDGIVTDIVQQALKNAKANAPEIARQVQGVVEERFRKIALEQIQAEWTDETPNLHRNAIQQPVQTMSFARDVSKVDGVLDYVETEVSEEPKK